MIPVENTTNLLSTLAALCRVMIESVGSTSPSYSCLSSHSLPYSFHQPDLTAKFRNPETILFCQRVMVGVIILYDHVHHQGAFSKRNPSIDVSFVCFGGGGAIIDVFKYFLFLQIRASIKVLKMHDNPHLEGLLNALRYTTKHLNDESTPKEVKKMLAN